MLIMKLMKVKLIITPSLKEYDDIISSKIESPDDKENPPKHQFIHLCLI